MLEKIFIAWENYVMASRFGHWRIFQKVSEFLLMRLAYRTYVKLGIMVPSKITVQYIKEDDIDRIIREDAERLALNEERYSTIPNMVYRMCKTCQRPRMFSLLEYTHLHGLIKCEICDSEQHISSETLKKLSKYWEM